MAYRPGCRVELVEDRAFLDELGAPPETSAVILVKTKAGAGIVTLSLGLGAEIAGLVLRYMDKREQA